MTRDQSTIDGKITSEEALEGALTDLLCNAYANDVDVEGGWNCRNGPGLPDWEAVVVELRKDADD